jgi:hypothetical protein
MLEPDFQRRRDAVEIGLQQLMAEIPRRLLTGDQGLQAFS